LEKGITISSKKSNTETIPRSKGLKEYQSSIPLLNQIKLFRYKVIRTNPAAYKSHVFARLLGNIIRVRFELTFSVKIYLFNLIPCLACIAVIGIS